MTRQTKPANQSIADELTGRPVLLNGCPASVSGRLNRFATITTVEPPYLSADWSWEAVARILERDGQFQT